MIDAGVLTGPAFEALKWIVARLADSDDPAKLGENTGKLVGGLATSLLGEAATERWEEVKSGLELRDGREPLNGYIEQAYRLAELGALGSFLRRLQSSGQLATDPHGGADAQRTIQSLSSLRRAVHSQRDSASIDGIRLDHLASTLASLTRQDWRQADEHVRRLRHDVEERALREIEFSSNVPTSPAFRAAFREGLGDAVPPWFGLLSHHFMHVLLSQHDRRAQESLALRMLARVAARAEPGTDPQVLQQLLQREVGALHARGETLTQHVEAMLEGLGRGLGSRLDDVSRDLAALSRQFSAFAATWQQQWNRLQHCFVEVNLRLEQAAAQLDRIEALLVGLAPDRRSSAAPVGTWRTAGLPSLPPPERTPLGRRQETAAVRAFAADPAASLLRVAGRSGSGKTTVVAHALADSGDRPLLYLKAAGTDALLSATLLAAFDRLLAALGEAPLAADVRYPAMSDKAKRLFDRLSAHGLRALLVLDSLEQALGADGRLVDADLEGLLLASLQPQRALQVIVCAQRMPQLMHDGRLSPLLAVARERQHELTLGAGLPDPADGVAVLLDLTSGTRPELAVGHERELRSLVDAVAANPVALKHVAIALADDPLLSPDALRQSLRSDTPADDAALAVQHALVGRSVERLVPSARRLLLALAVLGGSATAQLLRTTAGDGADLRALLEMVLLGRDAEGRLTLHDSERAWLLRHADAPLLAELRLSGADALAAASAPPERWTSYADAENTLQEISMRVDAGQVARAAALRERAARRLYDIGRSLAALRVLDAAGAAERAVGDAGAFDLLRAECLWKIGAYDAASRQCETSLAAAEGAMRPGSRVLRQIHATCRLELGDADAAVDDGRRLVSDLRDAHGEAAVRTRARIDLAFALSVAGRQDEALAEAAGAQADADAVPAGQHDGLAVLARAYLGLVHSYRGDFASARRLYTEALRLARRQPGLYERAIAFGHFAELEVIEGRFDMALDLASRSLEAEADTDAMNGSWCNWLIGMVFALDPARDVQAEAHARAACRFTRLLNDPNPRTLLGLLLLRRGDRVKGIGELEHALATTDVLLAACSRNWEAWLARGLALALLAAAGRADVDEALAAYRAGHAASPWPGHLARISVQMRIAATVLEPAGLVLWPGLRALYGARS
ncbi:MAG: hypothetical protein KIT35_25175 [Piscinibacter sp.]|uniref:hypothetical protein n=1 Tax=Piscinibacter sp. TaxID=1903157 RepID=UPI0025833E9A|nr:hypothetical protein [Piscinibacter sp.]MCW5667142.1 hypothetical protein [Piscinibacter sp.]